MSRPIEDYALIGDLHTAALVSTAGSIDWLCLPRFDAGSTFAALLGTPEHGHWRIAPADAAAKSTRQYRGDTLILETLFELPDGSAARLIDFMPLQTAQRRWATVVRIVEGVRGSVPIEMSLIARPDYAESVPWLSRHADGQIVRMSAGPDSLYCRASFELRETDHSLAATFTVQAGERHSVVLAHRRTDKPMPDLCEAASSLDETERFWTEWSAKCTYRGAHRDVVLRSLITLKALTYAPTGGIVAAPTTSLPEQLGGVRNWDYRYCWVRDATFSLVALTAGGFEDEANAWSNWLLHAVAGDPARMQIMYGLAGERRLLEWELPWLPGYAGSRPVRVGNGAYSQRQLDVYGEAIAALFQRRLLWDGEEGYAWKIELELLKFLADAWREPDAGIWESRGPPRHYTHSKVMCWLAFDCAIKTVEWFGNAGPVEQWRAIRDEIRQQVLTRGFNASLDSFVSVLDGDELDAALLMLPLIGFIDADDPKMLGTIRQIERTLLHDGAFVYRYHAASADQDGFPPGEGAFLVCSFWLVANYTMCGRMADAERLFNRLCVLQNDVGLLSEEYDPRDRRLVGNFPQAITHVGLIKAAAKLDGVDRAPTARLERHAYKGP